MYISTITILAFIAILSGAFVLADVFGRKWAEAKGIVIEEAGEDFGEE